MRLDSDRSNALFTDARNPLGAGLNNSQNGWYVGAWLDLALSKNGWGMMDGTWAVVKIGLQFNRLIQVIGESVRIPGAWADIDGLRMSSLVALWNRLDC